MKSKYLISMYILAVLFSCAKEPSPVREPSYPGVDQALWPYFQEFEQEAALRGIEVDLNQAGITANISEIDEGNVIGRCQYGRIHGNHVTVDQTFWNRSGQLGREMVVFHELGHCYLGRGHLEERFQSGSCVSIMRSGTCCCRDAYRTSTRSYYVDELFGVD